MSRLENIVVGVNDYVITPLIGVAIVLGGSLLIQFSEVFAPFKSHHSATEGDSLTQPTLSEPAEGEDSESPPEGAPTESPLADSNSLKSLTQHEASDPPVAQVPEVHIPSPTPPPPQSRMGRESQQDKQHNKPWQLGSLPYDGRYWVSRSASDCRCECHLIDMGTLIDVPLPTQFLDPNIAQWYCCGCQCPPAPQSANLRPWREEAPRQTMINASSEELKGRVCGCRDNCYVGLERYQTVAPYSSRGVTDLQGTFLSIGPAPPLRNPKHSTQDAFFNFQRRRYKSLFPELFWAPIDGGPFRPAGIGKVISIEIRDIDPELIGHSWFEVFMGEYLDNATVTVSAWEEKDVRGSGYSRRYLDSKLKRRSAQRGILSSQAILGSSKLYPRNHPMANIPHFKLQGPWRDDIHTEGAVSKIGHVKHALLHLSTSKAIKCRTAVLLCLVLRRDFVAAERFFRVNPWSIATDVREAKLGWIVSRDPSRPDIVFLDYLLNKLKSEGRSRTDDMTLQACTSLLISHLEGQKASLVDETSYTIQGYLHKLFCNQHQGSTTMMAVANALAYGALAVFLSDNYETKSWKYSGWEAAVGTSGAVASAAARASGIPAVGSTLSAVVKVGSKGLSMWASLKQAKMRKVVLGVARKFQLQVLREAEERQLRNMRGVLQTKASDGGLFSRSQLDDYIYTASVVFNIIVAETKVPLEIEVTGKADLDMSWRRAKGHLDRDEDSSYPKHDSNAGHNQSPNAKAGPSSTPAAKKAGSSDSDTTPGPTSTSAAKKDAISSPNAGPGSTSTSAARKDTSTPPDAGPLPASTSPTRKAPLSRPDVSPDRTSKSATKKGVSSLSDANRRSKPTSTPATKTGASSRPDTGPSAIPGDWPSSPHDAGVSPTADAGADSSSSPNLVSQAASDADGDPSSSPDENPAPLDLLTSATSSDSASVQSALS